MDTPDNTNGADSASGTDRIPPTPARLPAAEVVKKLAIWTLFAVLLYLTRDFFFTGFMTFLFSYLALGLIGWCMRRLAGKRLDQPSYEESAALRRLVTVGVFVLVPLVLVGLGIFIMPRLIQQAQELGGWLSHVSPEAETARLLEDFVGPSEFKHHYKGPEDPKYQKDFEEFKKSQVLHVKEYQEFPNLEAWVEGSFSKQFAEAQQGRVRSHLLRAGVSSKEFEQWFLKEKVPELQAQAKKLLADKGRIPTGEAALTRAAASATPEQLLEQARRDPAALALLREEWIADELKQVGAPGSPSYDSAFHAYYTKRAQESPAAVPYTYEQYLALQKARPQGPRAFGDTFEKLRPSAGGASAGAASAADARADFEAAKKHELFREWWGTSSVAKFIRHQVETASASAGSGRMDGIVASLLGLPVDLGTALLLSFFICIDFPQLKRAAGRLRETWLRDVYDEVAPAFVALGHLIGRALHAQGLIALCNAIMMFIALTFLGVEHPVLLSFAVFVLCLVPTLGTIIAWVIIAGVALVQPGGGLSLALQASGAVMVVVLLETFVFSPRILGRMMELHPVLIIAILPVAQYFFGVWGLILATPVAVYVIHVLILQRGLPGSKEQVVGRVTGSRVNVPELGGRS